MTLVLDHQLLPLLLWPESVASQCPQSTLCVLLGRGHITQLRHLDRSFSLLEAMVVQFPGSSSMRTSLPGRSRALQQPWRKLTGCTPLCGKPAPSLSCISVSLNYHLGSETVVLSVVAMCSTLRRSVQQRILAFPLGLAVPTRSSIPCRI